MESQWIKVLSHLKGEASTLLHPVFLEYRLVLPFLFFKRSGIVNTNVCWRRNWQPTLILLPGKSHAQRSLVSCSPSGRKELDMTEQLTHTHTHTHTDVCVYKQMKSSNFSFSNCSFFLHKTLHEPDKTLFGQISYAWVKQN